MSSRCLCCQKPLEAAGRYHPRCLSRLFGSPRAPAIPFKAADLPAMVTKDKNRMSISGVQPKASVRVHKETWTLEAVATGGTHILKPEPEQFPQIPQNENLCMNMAEELAFRVPPHGLFEMADGKLCYVIKRFDRAEDGRRIAKETMFQILGSTDKYSGSLEEIGKMIRAHAANVGLDTVDFFERVLFCFLTGNGDMHLKNWALLGAGQEIALAPCYDLVCSRLYIKNEADTALRLNDKQNKLKPQDFAALAARLEIDSKAAANIFGKLKKAQEKLREMIVNSELRSDLRQELLSVLASRYRRLYGAGIS
jgi:serine/threonine-protein kinase HipA